MDQTWGRGREENPESFPSFWPEQLDGDAISPFPLAGVPNFPYMRALLPHFAPHMAARPPFSRCQSGQSPP